MARWYGYNIESFQHLFRHNVTIEGGFNLTGILAYGGSDGKFVVLDGSGVVGTRTLSNLQTDLGIVSATTSASGIVELATTAETTTGTDTARAVTPDGLKDGYQGSANVTTLGTITSGEWNGSTIEISKGGTGQTTRQNALDALAGGTTSGRYLRGDGSNIILGAIQTGHIPTLNQDTTGNADTATNLVASTSTAVQLGTVELGHASDTTLSRSASGTLAVEGKNVRTEDKHLFIKQGSFALDPGTARIYFPMTGTAENTSAVGVAQPFLAPVNGKLLKIHLRSNKDHSGFNQTFHIVNWDDDEQFTTGAVSDLGAKTVTGVDNNNVITIDFQSGLDSGTNEFTAGELIALSVTNASDISGNTKYLFTAVFEFDFSSY
tara:strand:+ start:477 stop:1610 length:1134 start_codon:yes stop_codon:yes gene_type:complete